MHFAKSRVYDGTVLLVAEDIEQPDSIPPLYDRGLEMLDSDYTHYVITLLEEVSRKVLLCSDLRILPDTVKGHDNLIVVPLWSGSMSRSRMALAPAICESLDLPYVGADAYAKFLCQDKHLAKQFASSVGMKIANGALIRTSDDLHALDAVSFPIVIKPNSEGTSIGVRLFRAESERSSAESYLRESLDYFSQPILVEEFAPGREVMLCVYGTPDRPCFLGASEVHVPSNDVYFEKNIFGVDLKRDRFGDKPFTTRDVSDEIDAATIDLVLSAFRLLGKMDYLRVDGRLLDGKLVFIEFSPLPFFGPWGALGTVLKRHGITLSEIMRDLLELALRDRGPKIRSPNGKRISAGKGD